MATAKKSQPKTDLTAELKNTFTTPPGTIRWVHLTQTDVVDGKDTEEYTVTVCFDPADPKVKAFMSYMQELQLAAVDFLTDQNKKDARKVNKIKTTPTFKWAKPDYDADEDGNYTVKNGKFNIKFKTKYDPAKGKVFIRENGKAVPTTPDQATWGSTVIVKFKLSPYHMATSVGASFKLQAIAILEKAEGSGVGDFDEAFTAYEDEHKKQFATGSDFDNELAEATNDGTKETSDTQGDDVPF